MRETTTTTLETLSDFVAQSHLSESLVRAVVQQMGGWEAFQESAGDVAEYGIDSGFSGFTYYSDTVPFSETHRDLILHLCEEMADDLGDGDAFQLISGFGCVDATPTEVARAIFDEESEDRTAVYNALAWFAAEEVSRSFADMYE